MKDICTNCGAWRGLHEMETDKCPLGGIERFPNVWGKTYYAEQDDNIEDLKKEFSDFRDAVAKDQSDDILLIAKLRAELVKANTAASANLRMASEQAQKVGALKMAVIKIAGICNAELFDCEDVKREDLIDTVQAYFDIQQITDGILEATK